MVMDGVSNVQNIQLLLFIILWTFSYYTISLDRSRNINESVSASSRVTLKFLEKVHMPSTSTCQLLERLYILVPSPLLLFRHQSKQGV